MGGGSVAGGHRSCLCLPVSCPYLCPSCRLVLGSFLTTLVRSCADAGGRDDAVVLATFPHREGIAHCWVLVFFFIFSSPQTSSVSNRFTAWSCPRGCLSMTAHLLSKPHYEQELHWLSSKQDKSCASSFVEWKHMISWITQGYRN